MKKIKRVLFHTYKNISNQFENLEKFCFVLADDNKF